jgi:hypothetical protein
VERRHGDSQAKDQDDELGHEYQANVQARWTREAVAALGLVRSRTRWALMDCRWSAHSSQSCGGGAERRLHMTPQREDLRRVGGEGSCDIIGAHAVNRLASQPARYLMAAAKFPFSSWESPE